MGFYYRDLFKVYLQTERKVKISFENVNNWNIINENIDSVLNG